MLNRELLLELSKKKFQERSMMEWWVQSTEDQMEQCMKEKEERNTKQSWERSMKKQLES